MKLLDKIALITDASNPCGRAIAHGFARAGADCVVLDAQVSAAEKLATELRGLGRRAVGFACDVRSKAQVAAAVERILAQFGRIDILLNCSSADIARDFLTVSADDFNGDLDRGPKAYFLFCQAVGRIMAQQRAGKIINLASTDARIGSGESVCTSAAHSSIDALSRAVAQALGFYGVNANALLCGPIAKESLSAEERGERLRRMPFGRLAEPADFVGAAIFLASDDAKFVAGESLCVDAGYANAAVTEDGFRPAWGRVWHEFEVPTAEKTNPVPVTA
jgi:NAD(P)-dependent dehydrogenase (short-subunit alcohol dehydrogenase family)